MPIAPRRRLGRHDHPAAVGSNPHDAWARGRVVDTAGCVRVREWICRSLDELGGLQRVLSPMGLRLIDGRHEVVLAGKMGVEMLDERREARRLALPRLVFPAPGVPRGPPSARVSACAYRSWFNRRTSSW